MKITQIARNLNLSGIDLMIIVLRTKLDGKRTEFNANPMAPKCGKNHLKCLDFRSQEMIS